jgi:hypothetical protein
MWRIVAVKLLCQSLFLGDLRLSFRDSLFSSKSISCRISAAADCQKGTSNGQCRSSGIPNPRPTPRPILAAEFRPEDLFVVAKRDPSLVEVADGEPAVVVAEDELLLPVAAEDEAEFNAEEEEDGFDVEVDVEIDEEELLIESTLIANPILLNVLLTQPPPVPAVPVGSVRSSTKVLSIVIALASTPSPTPIVQS